MFTIGLWYFGNTNTLEMRKLDLLRIDEELFEVVRRIPYQKFTKNVDTDGAQLLREWVGCEKILRSNQTNEYLFVNLIEEANIIEEETVIEEEKPTKKLI
jgi:hypothetical protein